MNIRGRIAERITGWSELTYFVASIAEAAEKYDRALILYRRMRNAPKSPLTAEILAAKIASLEGMATTPSGDTKAAALQKLKKSASEATQVLNWLAEQYGTRIEKLNVEVGTQRLENTRQAMLLTKLLLGLLAGLILAVGGIGIMNVLLAAVSFTFPTNCSIAAASPSAARFGAARSRRRLDTCSLTACSLMPSSCAISLLPRPLATSSRTAV